MSTNPFHRLDEQEPPDTRPPRNIKTRINATIDSFSNSFKFLEFFSDMFSVLSNMLKNSSDVREKDDTKNSSLEDGNYDRNENENQQPPDKNIDKDKKE